MRSGDRRRKSAKARNRGRYARSAVPQAQLWGFKRRACRVHASARREVERLRRAKHAGGFALIASGQKSEDRAVICGTSKEFVRVDARSSERRGRKRRHFGMAIGWT